MPLTTGQLVAAGDRRRSRRLMVIAYEDIGLAICQPLPVGQAVTAAQQEPPRADSVGRRRHRALSVAKPTPVSLQTRP